MGCGASKDAGAERMMAGSSMERPFDLPERMLALRDRARKVQVRDVYKLGKVIGEGGFAQVRMAIHRETKEMFAIKVMDLPGGSDKESCETRECIFKEIAILCCVNHPSVITMIEYFEAKKKVYLVMELLKGGELLEALLMRNTYSEEDAKLVFRQLLEALRYLHGKGIVHRDLKLENILLATHDDFTTIKLADFGLAKMRTGEPETALQTVCGTPQYVAPEMLESADRRSRFGKDKYSASVDMWSAGVLLFMLLGGHPPFSDDHEERLFRLIKRGEFSFHAAAWAGISAPAKDLIRKLLVVQGSKRLTASEALRHPWWLASERAATAPAAAAAANSSPTHLGATVRSLRQQYSHRESLRLSAEVVKKESGELAARSHEPDGDDGDDVGGSLPGDAERGGSELA